ncbi:MATE family efflux transporter [Aminipila terrae]|uniref:MATE family efflux transporter n=1 Tax=Aminipila terrae TaxID=2697030 RepID=A0A6P1MEG6_9FIRM|nr:MATE family efflux transporter [Aminipila terrae]QHI72221.1 MATE family efflux transporter [Aminipila terrae]
MENSIQKNYNFTKLIRFSIPTIAMMVFMSMYSIVDGAFVSIFINTNALSALNIAYPLFNVVIAMGVMLGAGGSAIIAKKIGETKFQEAKENFSLIVYTGIALGLIMTIIGGIFMKPLLIFLGANNVLMNYCYDYAFTLLLFTTPAILQMIFQYLFITAGNPHLGFGLTIAGGCLNIILDYVFIVPLNMGISGAALATGLGILIPSTVGILYFSFNRKGSLYFVKTKIHMPVLLHGCGNGSSEMVTEFSNAVITFLYNLIMMKYIGEDGVAAITILLYVDFLLKAALLGFSMGVSPVISYNYGSQNIEQIKKLFKYCISFVLATSTIIYIVSILCAPYLTGIFAHNNAHVYKLAMSGFMLYNISFLFSGFNIFSSALFTAFSNGKISAVISFLRTFLFLSAGLLLLPPLIGIKGAWIAVTISEGLSMLMSLFFLIKYRKVYQYL